MGDGGFWHNGLTSGIGNAVFNKHDGVFVIVDTRARNKNRSTNNSIVNALHGIGAK